MAKPRNALPAQIGPRKRSFSLRAEGDVDKDKRTVKVSYSSEDPVEDYWWGINEVLDHSPGSQRIGERQENMPLLFNHDRSDLLGVVEGISIENERGYATVRFGKDERGDWAMNQVADGILRNTSLLYRVYEYVLDEDDGDPLGINDDEDDDELPTYRAMSWETFEISLVTVPADASVGVGRAASDATENPVLITQRRSTQQMPDPTTATAGDDPSKKGGAAAATVDVETVKREARESERQRLASIRRIAGEHGLSAEFVAKHDESSVEQFREAVLAEIAVRSKNEAGAAEREQNRVREIEATAKQWKVDEKTVREAITKGTAIETFRGIVLTALAEKNDGIVPASPASRAIGLTDKERQSYSITKAMYAALTDDWSQAGFEREVSATIEKERKPKRNGAKSFFMPGDLPFQAKGVPISDVLESLAQRKLLSGRGLDRLRATYQTGSTSVGGALVETELLASEFIQVLRNATVTGQLGARFLTGLVGDINIPRQITQTATYWVGESVALTEGEGTFDQVQLRPHVVGTFSKVSRLMLQQSTPAIEMLVREDLLEVMALAIDLAAINGTGSSSQPTGIINTTGVGSVIGGTNGANLLFDYLIELYAAPLVGNAPQDNLAFAMNGKCKGYLGTLKASTGQYLWQPQQSVANGLPDTVVGYKYAVSNQLPYNLTKGSSSGICSEIIFGNWRELFIGEWGVTEIAVNPYDSTGFLSGDVLIRAFQTVDIGVRHPASFASTSDMLTPGF